MSDWDFWAQITPPIESHAYRVPDFVEGETEKESRWIKLREVLIVFTDWWFSR